MALFAKTKPKQPIEQTAATLAAQIRKLEQDAEAAQEAAMRARLQQQALLDAAREAHKATGAPLFEQGLAQYDALKATRNSAYTALCDYLEAQQHQDLVTALVRAHRAVLDQERELFRLRAEHELDRDIPTSRPPESVGGRTWCADLLSGTGQGLNGGAGALAGSIVVDATVRGVWRGVQ